MTSGREDFTVLRRTYVLALIAWAIGYALWIALAGDETKRTDILAFKRFVGFLSGIWFLSVVAGTLYWMFRGVGRDCILHFAVVLSIVFLTSLLLNVAIYLVIGGWGLPMGFGWVSLTICAALVLAWITF